MECLSEPIHGQIWGDVTKARKRQVHNRTEGREAHPDPQLLPFTCSDATATLQGDPKNEASMATRC